MITGIGNDIIAVERIAKSIRRFGNTFLERIFTPKEIEYCQKFSDSERHFAGRFAAKEAVSKALGCGIGKSLEWLDMEILPTEKGSPSLTLSINAQNVFDNPTILISISHCQSHATAMAVVQQLK